MNNCIETSILELTFFFFPWAVMDLVVISVCSSIGRIAGHRLMLALPGATARERHLQWEYRSPGLVYCSAVLLVEFQLLITTLRIFILWGHIAIGGKKAELLQGILWTNGLYSLTKCRRYGQIEVYLRSTPALLAGFLLLIVETSLACTAASSWLADICWQSVPVAQ